MLETSQIKAIAESYQLARHTPDCAEYRQFAQETIRQFERIVDLGIDVRTIGGTLTANSEEMFRTIERANVLPIAIDGAPLASGHPLADYIARYGLTVNTMFRAVHDFNGHFVARSPFETFAGEMSAYESHRRMYSPLAIPALYSETIGQLCVFYASGDFVKSQKACLIPEVR